MVDKILLIEMDDVFRLPDHEPKNKKYDTKKYYLGTHVIDYDDQGYELLKWYKSQDYTIVGVNCHNDWRKEYLSYSDRHQLEYQTLLEFKELSAVAFHEPLHGVDYHYQTREAKFSISDKCLPRLQKRYPQNGKEKIQWNDQVNLRDKNIKGANQIYKRFSELFPNVKKMSETIDRDHRGQAYLSGLGQTASIASNSDETMITASITASIIEPTIEATTESYRLIEAIEAVLGKPITDAQLIDLFKKRFSEMSPELKQKLINELVSSQSESSSELVKPPIDPKKAKRVKWGGVEYRVGDQNSTSFSLYRAGHPGELFWIQKSLVEIIE